MIGAWRANKIRVLTLAIFVSRALDGRSIAIAERQWFTALADRVNLMVERVSMPGAIWETPKHVLAITCRDPHQLLQCMIRCRAGRGS
jgi:hypothetical protein